MDEISFCERTPYDEDEDEAEMSQDSKQEKRIDVENPPRTRPMSRIGRKGKSMSTHDTALARQKMRHVRFRPLKE